VQFSDQLYTADIVVKRRSQGIQWLSTFFGFSGLDRTSVLCFTTLFKQMTLKSFSIRFTGGSRQNVFIEIWPIFNGN